MESYLCFRREFLPVSNKSLNSADIDFEMPHSCVSVCLHACFCAQKTVHEKRSIKKSVEVVKLSSVPRLRSSLLTVTGVWSAVLQYFLKWTIL